MNCVQPDDRGSPASISSAASETKSAAYADPGGSAVFDAAPRG